MTVTLRIILIFASMCCFAWIVMNIRKAKVRIEDAVFWICFSAVLVLISIFPQLIDWGARITGIQSAQNFLFLVILFILIVKLFRMTLRLSQVDSRLQHLVQTIAIEEREKEEKVIKDFQNGA
jgi:hypothetical protein